jgi:2,3,4,5-tetrahydropyridine-2-carboxylate N-succinyltransferase
LNLEDLRRAVEAHAADPSADRDGASRVLQRLLDALESGAVRAAEPTSAGWRVHPWVKQGILLAFRIGQDCSTDLPPVFHFRDRDTLPAIDGGRVFEGVRVVPGGTTVRRGAHLASGVVIMPPAFVNVGAHVGSGAMIDSHVLVGSCAQIGARVHLSAAVQIGGVLEPVGALPVIIEDDAFVGGGCGVFEGTRVGARAVLAPGVVLTRAVALHDLVRERILRAAPREPLAVPDGAVVVPGSRPAQGEWARLHGLHLQAPVIVKYRDPGTEAAVALEQALR